MKKYQVLLVGTLPPQLGSRNYGGVAKVVWELANALRKRGVDLAVATLGKYYGGTKVVGDIPVYSIGFDPKIFISTIRRIWINREIFRKKSLKNCVRLAYALYLLGDLSSKVQFDIIHVHHVFNQIPLAARLLEIKTPIVATLHSFTESVLARSESKKKNVAVDLTQQMRCVDFVSFVSRSVREQGQEAGVTLDKHNTVIYNGIDFAQYPQDNISEKARQIIFVGALEKSKGVLLLTEALNCLDSTVDKILWIGRGSLEKKISQLMNKSTVKSELSGFVDNRDVVRLMSESDLLVVPSVSESFGLVYIEALFAGTPVIGFDRIINEFRQVLELTGREELWLTPFMPEQESPQDLAEKILHGMEIKQRGTYLEEAMSIRQKVIDRFSWDRISKEYEQVYSMLLSNNIG